MLYVLKKYDRKKDNQLSWDEEKQELRSKRRNRGNCSNWSESKKMRKKKLYQYDKLYDITYFISYTGS